MSLLLKTALKFALDRTSKLFNVVVVDLFAYREGYQ